MKVERVHIKNVRAFDELDLQLGSGGSAPQLVALTGVNGSGKSTVLQAIADACRGGPDAPYNEVSAHLRRKSGAPSRIEVILNFTAEEITELAESSRLLDTSVAPEPSRLSFLEGAPPPLDRPFQEGYFKSSEGRRALGVAAGLRFWRLVYLPADRQISNASVEQIQRVTGLPSDFVLWQYSYADVKQQLVNLDHQRLKRLEKGAPDPLEPYRDLTRDLFRDKVFHEVDEQYRVLFRLTDGTIVTFEDLSSGEQAVLALFGSMFRSDLRHSVYLIDEPEQHLHPLWLERMATILGKRAQTQGGQYIFATHSVELCEGILALGGDVYDLSSPGDAKP